MVLFSLTLLQPLFAVNQWKDVHPRIQEAITKTLPLSTTELSETDVTAYTIKFGTRTATYNAASLLLRSHDNDRTNAIKMIRSVLSFQVIKPNHRDHGVYRKGSDPKLDENWREFVGLGLIVVLEEFGDLLPVDLVGKMDESLLAAATGAGYRNVNPAYTNISVMSSFLMHYVGTKYAVPQLTALGFEKAKTIKSLYYRDGIFAEYNSPTYYGVTMFGLACWRRYARDEQVRLWGTWLQNSLWDEISKVYHPGLKNFSGPAVRSYGIDMNEYVGLAGLWVALVFDDPFLAPVPPPGQGKHQFEWNSLGLYQIVGSSIPDIIRSRLIETSPSTPIHRHDIPYNPATKTSMKVHIVKHPTWMMGSGRGFSSRSYQRVPATIHWKVEGQQKVGWLAVWGESGADATINGDKLSVYLPVPDKKVPFILQIAAPEIESASISESVWELPGARFRILRNSLTLSKMKIIDDIRNGRLLRLEFDVPTSVDPKRPVLEIVPEVFAK